ncbi:MAG: hypothetical protein LBR12_04015 [Opitutaceae bacterium]|jgi:hypothetical protein|nr:hypothetical protein [Opitutaceae bacterium]
MRAECPWTDELRKVLRKYDLSYAEIVSELDWKSLACPCRLDGVRFPCVSVNGVLLPDISGAEFESYLLSHGLVEPRNNERVADAAHPGMAPLRVL